ncbi:MAG: heme-binding protein [Planctomycetota bacterium]|nr:heme-binding protein [Planctomycetota bacterium]
MISAIALISLAQTAITTAPSPEARAAAVRELEAGLELVRAEAPEFTDAQRAARLRQAATAAAGKLGERSLTASRLAALAAGSDPFVELQRETKAIATDIEFTPVLEADRPRGFPGATPVGEVLVLDYPACRLARVPMARQFGPENGAFWKLFQHIESNGIPMTAPVEMTYDGAGKRQTAMAFLYASTEVGRLGPAGGDVEVADVAPVRVASIGLRGRRTEERVQQALRSIEGWLAQQSDLEAAGSMRVMGWNGPMTPIARSYHEVQLPVRAVAPGTRPAPANAAR